MRRLLILSLGICILSGMALAQKHQARLANADIQHYKFEVKLTDAHDTIFGKATVTVAFSKDVGSFELDLVKASEGKGMSVESILIGGKEANFSHNGDQLIIALKAKKNEVIPITINYKGAPQTGLVISENKYGDRTFFGDNWPDRGKHWLPIFDHPSDKATVEWIVTAPSHYEVVGNGKLLERSALNDEVKLTHWRSEVPLPTKVMVFGAARFAIQEVENVKGTPVSSWVYPQDRENGFHDYALAAPILDWFIGSVGPYPYAKLANVQSKTQFGGMENASNIFYSENSVNGERTAEGLIAHEIAHQWFGNSASEGNWHHIWLSEGFATYFTNLYMESTYGRDTLVSRLEEQRQTIIDFSKQQRVPIVNPQIENYMQLLNPNSYQKGGWVLHMLRKELGGLGFQVGIREYYKKYTLSNATTKDLANTIENLLNKDLGWFFDQWVYQAGQPELQASWSYRNGKVDIDFIQVQPEDFTFNLEFDLHFEDGSKERRTVLLTDKKQNWREEFASKPVRIVLDPDTWLLFEGKVAEK